MHYEELFLKETVRDEHHLQAIINRIRFRFWEARDRKQKMSIEVAVQLREEVLPSGPGKARHV